MATTIQTIGSGTLPSSIVTDCKTATTITTSASSATSESPSSSTLDISTNGTNTPPQERPTTTTTTKTSNVSRSSQADLDHSTAEHVITRLLHIHAGLTALYPNIQPGETTNALFSEMVSLCIVPYNEAACNTVLNDPRIQTIIVDLRKYSAEGEGMLEQYWARRMLSSPFPAGAGAVTTPPAAAVKRRSTGLGAGKPGGAGAHGDSGIPAAISLLRQFPYYQNYVDLARLELNAILSVSTPAQPPRKFAFLGSGPMPLTAICLAQLLDPAPAPPPTRGSSKAAGASSPWAWSPWPRRAQLAGAGAGAHYQDDDILSVQIHNIDRCPTAISLSSQLCSKLGRLARCLTFECTEASDSTDLTSFDVVYLAALVGTEAREKAGIIQSVAARMRTGALLVMRSAHGMRQVLYPVVEPAGAVERTLGGTGVVPLVVVHPWNEVVNSVVVGKVVR